MTVLFSSTRWRSSNSFEESTTKINPVRGVNEANVKPSWIRYRVNNGTPQRFIPVEVHRKAEEVLKDQASVGRPQDGGLEHCVLWEMKIPISSRWRAPAISSTAPLGRRWHRPWSGLGINGEWNWETAQDRHPQRRKWGAFWISYTHGRETLNLFGA